MRTVTITLIAKPDCHLCDEAREIIDATRQRLTRNGYATQLQELNMVEDPALVAQYAEDIPVVLIDGRRHSFWRVDATRLTAAVEKRARGGIFKFSRSRKIT